MLASVAWPFTQKLNAKIKSVGTMHKAFQYGAPPHGGIAWGVDRLMTAYVGSNAKGAAWPSHPDNAGRVWLM